MPPPNLTAATAITITTLPYSITTDPEGTAKLWYKYTATIDTCISILSCNSVNDAEFEMYLDNPPSLLTIFGTGQPQIWPIKIGDIVHFNIHVSSYTAGKTFSFSVNAAPTDTIQAGDLIVSEDEGHTGQNVYDTSFRGFWPYTWYSENGAVRYVSAKFPATELGSFLANGRWGVISAVTNQLFIYSAAPELTEIGRFVIYSPAAGTIETMATDFTYFYIAVKIGTLADQSIPSVIYKVSNSGTITGPIATLAVGNIGSAAGSGGNATSAVSRDGTILYYSHGIMGGQVHRHNLLTDTALSSFDVPTTSVIPADVIALSDGTIAAIFYAGLINKVAHYSAAGTLLNLWDFGTFPWEIHHICHEGTDHANKIWVWTQDENTSFPTLTGKSKFQLLELSTGSILKEFTKDSFIRGVGPFDSSNTCIPSERFGAPDSCPLMVVMGTSPVTPGIFKIVTDKRTDHDGVGTVKIPNPTFRTGLIP